VTVQESPPGTPHPAHADSRPAARSAPPAARPSHAHVHHLGPSVARGTRATLIGILISTVLAAVKILGGIFGQSYALIADGVESLLDIFGSSIVWGSLRYSARPPDLKHPYGHGKAEPLAAMVIAAALLVASIAIGVESVREIRTPHALPAAYTLVILVGVVITKEVLFRFLLTTGKDINSRAVETDAWHHRSDALTSLAAFVGISIALWKGPAYAAADDYAALFACGIIFFNGLRLLRGAIDDVMDAAPSADVDAAIREAAMTLPGVLGTHHLRARRSGMGYLVDLDIIVDSNITVRRGHDIAHEVKAKLMESHLGILNVLVHVEPNGEKR
jgi:cation diffusion facilitator family transporter